MSRLTKDWERSIIKAINKVFMSSQSKEVGITNGEMSRRSFIERTGKAITVGGVIMVMGGAGLWIKVFSEVDREVQKTHPSIPSEEVNAAEKEILIFQKNITQEAKTLPKGKGSIPVVIDEKLAQAFKVSDTATAYGQEKTRLTNEKGTREKIGIGLLVMIIGALSALTGIDGWVSSNKLKTLNSPTNTPPDASLPAPTNPTR